MEIIKILQIITGDQQLTRETLSDNKWFSLFNEIDSDELDKLFDEIPDLGEVVIEKLLSCDETGFYTIKNYFDVFTRKCEHSFDKAEYFSPEMSTGLPGILNQKAALYLIRNYGWYTPDGGINIYKRKSDFESLED